MKWWVRVCSRHTFSLMATSPLILQTIKDSSSPSSRLPSQNLRLIPDISFLFVRFCHLDPLISHFLLSKDILCPRPLRLAMRQNGMRFTNLNLVFRPIYVSGMKKYSTPIPIFFFGITICLDPVSKEMRSI